MNGTAIVLNISAPHYTIPLLIRLFLFHVLLFLLPAYLPNLFNSKYLNGG